MMPTDRSEQMLIIGVPLPELVPGWTPVWAQRLTLRLLLRVVFGRYESYGLSLLVWKERRLRAKLRPPMPPRPAGARPDPDLRVY